MNVENWLGKDAQSGYLQLQLSLQLNRWASQKCRLEGMSGGCFSNLPVNAGLVSTKTRSAMALAHWVLKTPRKERPQPVPVPHHPLEGAFANIQSDPPQPQTLIFHCLWNCPSGSCRLLLNCPLAFSLLDKKKPSFLILSSQISKHVL